MNVDKLMGMMKWSEPDDEVVVVVDGYEYPLTSIEIDERLGALYLKASDTPEDGEEESAEEEEEICTGTSCDLPETVAADEVGEAQEA